MLFRLLGPVLVNDTEVPPGARVRRLLALLMLEAPHSVGRLSAMDWVLGQETMTSESASAAFNVTLSRLRRWLRDHDVDATISSTAAGVRLVVADGEIDQLRFVALLDKARRADAHDPGKLLAITEALALWTGELAAGEDLPPHPVITALAERRLAAVEERAAIAVRSGSLDPTELGELLAWCEREPQRERLWASAMHALYLAGRQVDALNLYQRARRALIEQLGLEPGLDLVELERRILRHDPTLDERLPAVRSPAPRRSTELDRLVDSFRVAPFFGRYEELATVRLRLVNDAPLVTVVGPGGAGKSRLAIEAVVGIEDRWPDGIVFVPLAKVTDPALLADAVVSAFGAGPLGNAELATIAARWSGLRALLLLDTCEHLIDAVADLCAVITSLCPELQVLATSREPLRLPTETCVSVAPLPVPAPHADTDAIACSAAVQLFLARAEAVGWRPSSPDHALPAVAELCRQLDGLPLAIEIIAAHANSSRPDELLELLGGRLHAHAGLRRQHDQRHRTLADSIRWSYEQLTDRARHSLAACSVLTAGFDAAAADMVAGADHSELIGLAAKSLLVVDHNGPSTRYRMLDTVREFAAERLAEDPGAVQATLDRLLLWAAALSRQVATEHFGPTGTDWHRRLDLELPNLRTAITHALDSDHGDLVIEITVNLQDYFWWARSRLAEPRAWLELALDTTTADDERNRARGLYALGGFRWAQFDVEAAEALLRQARTTAERVGDRWVIGRATLCLAQLISQRGDPDTGWTEFQRHRNDIFIGFPGAAEAGIYYFEGNIAAQRGDDETAEQLLARSYALATTRSAVIVMTRLLAILARRRRAAGDTTTSDSLLAEACTLARRSGDVAALVRALLHRADLALETGAHNTATDSLTEAKHLLDRGIEAPAMVVRYHRCAARLASATDQHDRAARETEQARLLALALSHPRVPTAQPLPNGTLRGAL